MHNNKIFWVLLIILSLLSIIGCTVPEPVVEETVETINEEFVISGIENGKCVVREINLWSTTSMISKSGSVEKACGGIKVNAFEKVESSSLNRVLYHIKTSDGQTGWITDSFVNKNGICQTSDDCKSLSGYYERETSKYYPFEPEYVLEAVPDICLDGTCVECLVTRDCIGSQVCDSTTNRCVGCLSNNDCKDSSNIGSLDWNTCDLESKKCVECLTDDDCPNSDDSYDKDKTICKVSEYSSTSNSCVECKDNYDCSEDEYCSYGSCDKR